MKKIISAQGLRDGIVDDTMVTMALRERVDQKIEQYYAQEFPTEAPVHVTPSFTYVLFNGDVVAISLSFAIDNPPLREDHRRHHLRQWRKDCDTGRIR